MTSLLIELCMQFSVMVVMTQWILIEEFVGFDSALCNKNDRAIFFDLFHLRQIPFNGIVSSNESRWFWKSDCILSCTPSMNYYMWIRKRKIFVSSLILTDNCMRVACAVNVSKVKEIYVHFVSKQNQIFFRSILMKCGQLLSIRSWLMSDTSGIIDTLSKNCPNLTSCIMPTLVGSCARSISKIMMSCEKLNMVSFGAVVDDFVIQNLTQQNFECLSCIDFGGCTFSNSSLTMLAESSSSLLSLSLKGCHLQDSGVLVSLPLHLKQITVLNVGYCSILDDETLYKLGEHCHALTDLIVAGADRISDTGISFVCDGCRAIRSLDISECKLLTYKAGMSIAENLVNLKLVMFHKSRVMSPLDRSKMLHALSRRFADFSILDTEHDILGGWTAVEVTDCTESRIDKLFSVSNPHSSVFHSFFLKLSRLRELCIDGRRSSVTFNMLFEHKMHALTSLDLSSCGDDTSDSILLNLSLASTHLERLVLSGCIYVTDVGLVSIFRTNKALIVVNIRGAGISDYAIAELAVNCKSMQQLDVSQCISVTDWSVEILAPSCPKLTELNFSGTSITRASVGILFDLCKYLCNLRCDIAPVIGGVGGCPLEGGN